MDQLTAALTIKTIEESATTGVFEIEGLYAGYGLTISNALRRTLLSSLSGAAVTQIKIKGATHEFTTLPGLKEDLVELSLNFKKLRFKIHTDEPQVLALQAKGEGVVTGEAIKTNAQVELVNPGEVLGHLTTKSAELSVELTVERGRGYVPTNVRHPREKLPVGAIAIDALYSPVVSVNVTIEDMRVGDRTDYNRVRLEVITDGTISPSTAMQQSAALLREHFEIVAGLEVKNDFPEAKKSAKK